MLYLFASLIHLQLPYVAATCRTPLPTPSRALFRICATSSAGLPPDFPAEDAMFAMVFSRSSVLLRRHDSKTSSRGEAPWIISISTYCHTMVVAPRTSSSAILRVIELLKESTTATVAACRDVDLTFQRRCAAKSSGKWSVGDVEGTGVVYDLQEKRRQAS